MKLAAFKYTDTKGKITQRKVLVISQPSNKLTGIDVSDMDPAQRDRFALEYGRLEDVFRQNVLELQHDFDVAQNLRQFLLANIENMKNV